jgi:hypothetical protein
MRAWMSVRWRLPVEAHQRHSLGLFEAVLRAIGIVNACRLEEEFLQYFQSEELVMRIKMFAIAIIDDTQRGGACGGGILISLSF